MRRIALPTLLAFSILSGSAQAVDLTVPAARDTEPVILTGDQLGEWATPANQTVKLPLMDAQECKTTVDPERLGDAFEEGDPTGATDAVVREDGCHNRYSDPEVDTGMAGGKGTPTDRIVAFRWSGGALGRWVEVPNQVD